MQLFRAAVALLTLSVQVGCRSKATETGEFRAGLVTPGSIADAAWNSGAYSGLEQIRDSLGIKVSHVEARTPAEQEEALRTYAAQGYGLVFGMDSNSRGRRSESPPSTPRRSLW